VPSSSDPTPGRGSTAPLPDSPEQISTDWLTSALSRSFPGARVSSVEVADWSAGTTGRARLAVAYDGDTTAPRSIFVKLPPTDELQQAMVRFTGMGRREVLFYSQLASEVPVRCPRPYFAGATEDGSAYIMLLEDLALSNCQFPSVFRGATAAHARAVVGALARLHARYWNSPRFRDDLAWVDRPMRFDIGPQLVGKALADFGDDMPEAFRRMAELYIERTDEVCDLWEEGEQTLCHGDCHIGNQFQQDGTPGFLDWACVYRCAGVRDVSYFLANSIPSEMRRAEQRNWLELYRNALSEQGVDPPDAAALWRRYCRHAAYSWVAAVTTLSMGDKWQALRHGQEAVKRGNDAIESLNTVDVLLEDLA
jgi:thiamine kinase-like enzyme